MVLESITKLNQPGEWVTKEYLENILKNYKKDPTLTIIDYNFTPVTEKGESYGGLITRASVQFKRKLSNGIESINLIIKTDLNDDEFAMKILNEFDVFNREMKIYSEILPKINQLLKDAGITDFLFAESIHLDFQNSTMIFEDLCSKKFETINRLNGLDFDHAKIALRKLARLHAASARLQELYPEIFTTYNKGFFTKATTAYDNFFFTIIQACIDVIYEDFEGEYHKYAKKLELILPNIVKIGQEYFDPSLDQFNTFIHGDVWTSNLMFKYNEDKTKILDAVLIDFQFSCWAPATIELQYIFNIALAENVKRRDQDDLLQLYYDNFANALKALSFKGKIPSLNQVFLNFKKKSFYGLVVTCINQPIALAEAPEIDFHVVHGIDDHAVKLKKVMFKNKKIQENLKYWLPVFDKTVYRNIYTY